MRSIIVDKIASVALARNLTHEIRISADIPCEEGVLVAVEVLNSKSRYNTLELTSGRMADVKRGDVIVGALGHRNALHGYEGVLPTSVVAGQMLQVLNLGGVIGECVSHNPDVGAPFQFEVIGQVLVYPEFGSRQGRAANIAQRAVRGGGPLPRCPVVFVAGTCMNSGKTAAASAIVRRLRQAGLRVGGLKLTGISLMKDTLAMGDYGADAVLDFTDAGIVCTSAHTAAPTAHVLFSEMAARGVDVIVAETGDGIMGEYGVQAILSDPALAGLRTAFVFCANDPVGVSGGLRDLRESFGIDADLVTGPATDNRVGIRFVESLGVPALNARTDPKGVGDFVLGLIEARRSA
jgi:hypothetical protein